MINSPETTHRNRVAPLHVGAYPRSCCVLLTTTLRAILQSVSQPSIPECSRRLLESTSRSRTGDSRGDVAFLGVAANISRHLFKPCRTHK